jgi:hypothetical protein
MSRHITSGIWNIIANYNFHGQSHSKTVLSLASFLSASAFASLFICFSASLTFLALISSHVSLYLTCLNRKAEYDQNSEEIAADTDLLVSHHRLKWDLQPKHPLRLDLSDTLILHQMRADDQVDSHHRDDK